ncbi:glycosyltransferase family 2 protein [Evansella tamaricis]|uniref:Glycosyltransferase n=1 Tax=Evansella tamaricis TaxID=2069301 RepID=A0ABS6JLZ8_9BACI|nr:glycosyltransferase family 2 protein [Evansella tamaricis]MBU9713333.1 glycosyltransferase [Evansella tamaricis]
MNPLITFCMICKNEEKFIRQCLDSVKDFVDEIIIVDTGSTDKTMEVAKEFNPVIIEHKWNNSFADARNAGLDRAKGEWILFLDADEKLNCSDTNKLRNLARDNKACAYFLRLFNLVGKNMNDCHEEQSSVLRFFRNHPNVRFQWEIHEQIGGSLQKQFPFDPMEYLEDISITHYGYLNDIVIEKNKMERNFSMIKRKIEEDPYNAFHHYNLAGEYMRKGSYEDALQSLKKSRSLCKTIKSVGFGFQLVRKEMVCLLKQNYLEEAYETSIDALKLFPNSPDLHFYMGEVAYELGLYNTAINSYINAMKEKDVPKNYSRNLTISKEKAPFMLASLYERVGKKKKAIDYYERVLHHNPKHPGSMERIITLCQKKENELVEKLLFITQDDQVLENYLINLYVSDCFGAAETIYLFLTDRSKEKYNSIHQKIILLRYDNLSMVNDKRIKTIYQYVIKKKVLPSNEEDDFLRFLRSGEWPDNKMPTVDDYTELEFTYKLAKKKGYVEVSSVLLRLWEYFINIEKNHLIRGEWAWYLASNLFKEEMKILNDKGATTQFSMVLGGINDG